MDKTKEVKVYLIDLVTLNSEPNSKLSELLASKYNNPEEVLTDKEKAEIEEWIIAIAELQGYVFSLEGFQRAYNSNEVNVDYSYIYFL